MKTTQPTNADIKKIESAKIQLKNLIESKKLNNMSLNIILDDFKELLKNGKVETIFKSSIIFFENCGFTITKEKNGNFTKTIITL